MNPSLLLRVSLLGMLFSGVASALPLIKATGTRLLVADGDVIWRSDALLLEEREGLIVPDQIMHGDGWKVIAGGEQAVYGIDSHGALWGGPWDLSFSDGPIDAGEGSPWKTVSSHTNLLAIREDGTLWAAGDRYLGHATIQSSETLIQIEPNDQWAAVEAGDSHHFAIRSDGSLWAWGENLGRLGDGTTVDRPMPVRIGNDADWLSVTSGRVATMAIRTDGSLWAWGSNEEGIFGGGSEAPASSLVPLRVGTDNDWQQVAMGYGFAVGIKNNGTLWSWGSGITLIGNRALARKFGNPVPTQVGTENTWNAVESILDQSQSRLVAVKTDSSVWSWKLLSDGWKNTTALYQPRAILRLEVDGQILKNDRYKELVHMAITSEVLSTPLTIRNMGHGELLVSEIDFQPPFSLSGPFPPIPAKSSATVQLMVDSDTAGVVHCITYVSSNDTTLALFKMIVGGRVVSPNEDFDRDGLNDAAEVKLAALGFDLWDRQEELVEEFFAKSALVGLHAGSRVLELGTAAQGPLMGPAGNTLQLGLSFRDMRDGSPVPLETDNIRHPSDERIEISLPGSEDWDYLRIWSRE